MAGLSNTFYGQNSTKRYFTAVKSLETWQQLLLFIQQLLFLGTFHTLSVIAFKARMISFIL